MLHYSIAVVDSDTEYASRLSAFSRTTAMAARYRLEIWPAKQLQSGYSAGKPPDLLLVSADLSESLPVALRARCCLLVDKSGIDRPGFPTIERYQPMDTFFARIGELCDTSDRQRDPGWGVRKAAKIISVFSASGGSGKSVAAANMAAQLAMRGEPTFLASFERVPSGSLFPGSADAGLQHFEKLVYYLRKGDSGLGERFDSLKTIDRASGVHYLRPSTQPAEMKTFTAEDAERLVQLLLAGGHYSNLVFDLETGTDDVTLAVLHKSDVVIWLMTDDPVSRVKTAEVDAYLSAATMMPKRTGLVLNKYTGSMAGEWNGQRELFGRLPYVPAWKQAVDRAALLAEPVFYEQLLGLYDLLCGEGSVRHA